MKMLFGLLAMLSLHSLGQGAEPRPKE